MPNPAERPSWALRCLNLSEKKFVILLAMQHLELDGSGLTTFVEELRDAYGMFAENKTPFFEPVIQYDEYVEWQQEYILDKITADRAFFQGVFSSVSKIPTLPNHPGFSITTPLLSARYSPKIIIGLWNKMNEVAHILKVSPFSLLMANYAKWFSSVVEKSEVVIGMITNGRPDSKFKKTIGPFTAPFPVRIMTAEQTFEELVLQCSRLITNINARSYYPVADLTQHVPAFSGFPVDSY